MPIDKDFTTTRNCVSVSWTSSVGSKFMSASKIEGINDIDETYNSTNDLDSIFDHKSYDDIKKLLSTHFLGEVASQPVEEVAVEENFDSYAEIVSTSGKQTSTLDSDEDRKMQEILNDL